jgi:hypothetical protein
MRDKKVSIISILMFIIISLAYTDFRYYVWTYQFITMLPGKAELELYTRMDQTDLLDSQTVKWKRQIEVELGLTKKLDFSFYLVDGYKVTDGKTKFEEVKLRTRYKLANKNEFVVDPLLYVEYKIQADRSYPDKWETKLILAKDINDLNLALNIIPEEYYKSGTKEKDWKVEYAFGISYPIFKENIRLALEFKGDLKEEKHLLGPTFSYRGENFWTATGTVFGLNKNSDDVQAQVIIGLLF